jgi:hypothetical protein
MTRRTVLLVAVLAGCAGRDAGIDDAPAGPDLPDVPYITDTVAPGDEGGGNHPPVLAAIGDRVVAVGEKLVIAVQATDPDGDPLTFTIHGKLPDGAKFDKATRTLEWVPLQAGVSVFLTFLVSDGAAIDRETVEIKVVTQKTGHPPVLEKVSDVKAKVGQAVAVQLVAHDPDGGALTFAIANTAPSGASLGASTGLFQWTPAAAEDATVVTVAFEVRDPGGLRDAIDVRFLVGDVKAGSPPVLDALPEVAATVGKQVAFTVSATDPDGDDVTLALESEPPAGASFDPASGAFAWTPSKDDAGHAVDVTFSAADATFKTYATARIVVGTGVTPATCGDDAFEPDNDPASAAALAPGGYDLSICDTTLSPVDIDFFAIALAKGETVTVTVTFDPEHGDLDCDLSLDGSEESIVAYSATTGGEETLAWTSGEARDHVLAIYGVADVKYAVPYHLEVAVSAVATCTDDGLEDNDTKADASQAPVDGAAIKGLVLCAGDPDWFRIDAAAGDTAYAAVTPSSGTVEVELLGPDGTTVLDAAGPTTGPATVGAEKLAGGPVYVRVTSPGGAAYTFEALVEKATAGCDVKSCPEGDVCDAAAGQCVPDLCEWDSDCPDGLPCIDTYCVDPCAKTGDCRDGYSCKTFPQGRFCGVSGPKKTGSPCSYFTECAAGRICLFWDYGGYCAVYGCKHDSECTTDAACFSGGDFPFCARKCASDADCSVSEGFTCKTVVTVDGKTVTACVK